MVTLDADSRGLHCDRIFGVIGSRSINRSIPRHWALTGDWTVTMTLTR